jgi:hypothetical protein
LTSGSGWELILLPQSNDSSFAIEPPALPPPPMRHALFVILIALAGLLHVATIGCGDLYSQTEGQFAGAAREMVETHQSMKPTAPLRNNFSVLATPPCRGLSLSR